MSIKKVCYTFLKSCLLESVYKSRFVWFWQNSEARAVVLGGQQAVEEEEQSETRLLPIKCPTTGSPIV